MGHVGYVQVADRIARKAFCFSKARDRSGRIDIAGSAFSTGRRGRPFRQIDFTDGPVGGSAS
jgi:hypothetical protein